MIKLTAITAEEEPHSTIAAFLDRARQRDCDLDPRRRFAHLPLPRRRDGERTIDHSYVQRLVDARRDHRGGGQHPPASRTCCTGCLGTQPRSAADRHRSASTSCEIGDSCWPAATGCGTTSRPRSWARSARAAAARGQPKCWSARRASARAARGDNMSLAVLKLEALRLALERGAARQPSRPDAGTGRRRQRRRPAACLGRSALRCSRSARCASASLLLALEALRVRAGASARRRAALACSSACARCLSLERALPRGRVGGQAGTAGRMIGRALLARLAAASCDCSRCAACPAARAAAAFCVEPSSVGRAAALALRCRRARASCALAGRRCGAPAARRLSSRQSSTANFWQHARPLARVARLDRRALGVDARALGVGRRCRRSRRDRAQQRQRGQRDQQRENECSFM